jgi:transposase InsO family protein
MSLQGSLTIERMCYLAAVSRAGFYRWLRQTQPLAEDMEVRTAIQQIALEHRGRYGSRRIVRELERRGLRVNRKRVMRIMQQDNLLAVQARRFVLTTDSDHDLQVYLNLARRMRLTGINQLWVADITYLRLQSEFVYLALLLDVFSRKVVGWALARTLHASLVIAALERALRERQPLPGLVHHSDRGVQYACAAYVALLQKYEIVPSMSRPGNPYDNAFCESFIKTLKREEIYASQYQDLEDLQANLEVFIEQYYNRQRLHSALGYVSPEEFEAQLQNADGVESPQGASVSFFRHGEIYPSDGKKPGELPTAPQLIGLDESPAGYSSASCSPAELASASPTGGHPYGGDW